MGVNSLPKTVTRQRRGCDLNPGDSAPETSTLTTRLPSQPRDRELLSSPPGCATRQRHAALYMCSCCFALSISSLFFNDFCQINDHSIYHTDILEIFSVGRTMAVGDQFEISFSVPQGTLP